MVSSTSTSRQQSTNGNALLVSSPVILSPSASQFTSSINSSSGLTSSPSQLIATQNSLTHQQHLHQQSILQVIPQQQRPFHLYQHTPQMFLPGQNQIISQKNGISNANITNPVIKSATMVPSQQFSQNNQQTVVISQLPQLLSNSQQSIITSNKGVIETQKGNKFMFQNGETTIQAKSQILHNSSISSHSLIGPQQFKSIQSNPSLLNSQSSMLNYPTQLLGSIQQIPHHLTWSHNQGPTLMHHNSQIFLRPPQTVNDGQSLFIHATNSSIQTIPDTPIYVNPNTGAMQLVQASNSSTINALHPTIINKPIFSNIITSTNSTSSVSKINFNSNQTSLTRLKNIKPAVLTGNLNNSNSNVIKSKKSIGIKSIEPKQQVISKNKIFLQKTTQQMNAELLVNGENCQNGKNKSKNLLTKSESMKNIGNNINIINQKINKSLEKLDSIKTNNKKNDKKDELNIKKEKLEKKKHIQKAIVKPQILTHCIDGHIIQESSFPFQITCQESIEDYLKESSNNEINGISDNLANTDIKESIITSITSINKDFKIKPKKHSKINKQKLTQPITDTKLELDTKDVIETNVYEMKNKQEKTLIKNVYDWSIDEVYDFVEKYTSSDFAFIFKEQQIDGQALVLLNVAILREDLKLKLGPSLTINEKIKELKNESTFINEFLPLSGSNIYKWTVKDVYDFVLHLSSKEYAEEFEKQEMDGHALTLLSQENLIKDMKILFGPGLKILSRINELKKNSEKN